MGLGLQTGGNGGADRTPYVKYDARAGRMFRVDRVEVNGAWQSNQVDVTNNFSAVFDFANIEVGWLNYSDQGPLKAMAVLGKAPIPARPDGVNDKGKPAFRQGFNILLAMPKDQGGGVRELNSNAGCVIEAVDELHDKFTAAPEGKDGKLPVVRLVSATPVKSGQSTNYRPVFEVVSWVDRPPALNGQAPAAAPAAAPVAAPAPVPQPAPVSAGANDFG